MSKSKLLVGTIAAAAVCLAFQADDEAKGLPDGPGKDLVISSCLDCHGAANFRKLRLTQDEWADKVADMVDRGAKADERQQSGIAAYLASNFGKNSKVQVNSAPIPEFMVVLGFPPAEAQAIVAYRNDKGPFKDWEAISKVPGVDSHRVELQKEKMAF